MSCARTVTPPYSPFCSLVGEGGLGAASGTRDVALSWRERALVGLARSVCRQELGAVFGEHVQVARGAGVALADLNEALLHLVIYASFPKVLCALRELESAFGAAEGLTFAATPSPDENLFLQPEVRIALEGIDPDFADLAVRMGGEIWGRCGVTQKERAFMCIAAHVANSTTDLIPLHAEIGLRAGASATALREVIWRAVGQEEQEQLAAAAASLEGFLFERTTC